MPKTYHELAAQIRGEHQEILFGKDDLEHISTADIIRLFKLINPSVHELDLEDSGISKIRTTDEMVQIFTAIPWHIHCLDLTKVFIFEDFANSLRDASEYERILSAIPKWISRLRISGNIFSDIAYLEYLRAIPASVKFLYLQGYMWALASRDEFCAVIASIPETVTHLSLSSDSFKADLYPALAKIKPTVEYLSLRNLTLYAANIKVSEVLTYIPKTVARLSLSNDIIIRDDWELNKRLNALTGKVIDGIEWTNSSKDQFAFKKYADVKIRYGIFKTVPFYFDQDFVLTKGCAFATEYYQNRMPLLFREFTVKTEYKTCTMVGGLVTSQKVFTIPKGPVATVYAFLSFNEISRLALAKVHKPQRQVSEAMQRILDTQRLHEKFGFKEYQPTYEDLYLASAGHAMCEAESNQNVKNDVCCSVM